jgi:predicted TIM-barrel fold metal-dependent hydrolase
MSRLRFPWVHPRRRSDTEPSAKPPLYFGPVSNGEVYRAASPGAARIARMIMEKAEAGARRLGVDRREFLASSMGMATSLWALNALSGCSGDGGAPGVGLGDAGSGTPIGMGAPWADGGTPMVGFDAGRIPADPPDGGYFDVPSDPTDPERVCERMLDPSREFIFDVQTHHVNRANSVYDGFLRDQIRYTGVCAPGGISSVDCFRRNAYTRLMFLESDTTVAVLSGLPAVDDANNPITNAEIAESRDIINMMADGSERLINHHMVLPNQGGTSADAVQRQLDAMARTRDVYGKIGAWKCYPAWSPKNTESNAQDGYFLDDPATGVRFIEQGLALGVNLFCVHKGLPIPAFSTRHNDPEDIGRVAKAYPSGRFIVYHSGYGNQNNYNEGPYTEGARNGVNSLITALRSAGIGTGSNVYAELGTTWQLVTTLPVVGSLTAAAHVIGKLLKYVGEDNVVWGTDSIWYGSPQSQIESFLQFQISPELQARYGYPALTMERKRKILGLNAAKLYGIDPAATRCAVKASALEAYRLDLDDRLGGRRWVFDTPRLTSRRDFWALLRKKELRPG